MKLRFLILFILTIGCQTVTLAQRPSRIPAQRVDSTLITQPNGQPLYLILHGDERKHFHTTTDGFLLKQNRKGFFCYAKETCCGRIKASSRVAKNIAERSIKDNKYLKRITNNSNLHIYKK